MSSHVSAEITATCNALGYNNGLLYELDPYCKESIRDLIRYLRRDDENHEIRRQLGNSQVLQTDLLPMLIQHSGDEDLFDLLLRLLVNLMSPVILLYREELPAEKVSRNYYLQVLSQLQSAKAAFADEKIWKVLVEKLSSILKLEWADRGEEKGLIIERILILARNVLHVPTSASAENRPDNDASVHDQVLWAMHQSGLIDLFLYLASSENETQYYLHILEIVSLMLRQQTPQLLVNVSVTRSTEEKVKDNAALLVVRQKEIEEKAEKMRKYAGARHSRFGGTFVVKGIKSIGDRDMVVHKAPKEITQITFDKHKMKPRVRKNFTQMEDSHESRKSAYSVRLFLKEFCVEFLNGAYNPFMFSIREKISRGKAQSNDESYYFWALAFFMEFNRLYKFQIKLVSETLAVNIFHFVQTQLEAWFLNMTTDKKKIPLWSKRMHLALKAYKELMLTLCEMDRSPDESVRASSKSIKGNLFYVPDYRNLVYDLFSFYTPLKFSRSYLIDLVETTHIFLKCLEHFSKTTHNLVVQNVKKKSSKKKKKKKGGAAKKASARDREMIWELVGSEVSALLQNEELIPTNVVPFDAASDMSMDEQKIEAMKKIRTLLKDDNAPQAIGLLRAAREVWPEGDCFGSSEMDPSDELLAVREIFMTEIGSLTVNAPRVSDSDESGDDSSGGEMNESGVCVSEQSFCFFDYMKRYAKPSIVEACCKLLDRFEQNSETTNHYLIKLLHRIAVECKLSAMIFQASTFKTFQRILNSKNPSHKELQKFAVFIIRKFVEVAEKNKMVFMELLFWKNCKDAYEIVEGYGQEEAKRGTENRIWNEDQEQELRVLFEEYERDKPQPDAVDWIMQNLINKDRTRRNVMKKMKELGLKPTKVPKARKSGPKTKNQNSRHEMLDDASDQSRHGSDDSDHLSDAGSSDSSGSRTERALHKSGPPSMNTSRVRGSDNDDQSGSSSSDEDNTNLTTNSWQEDDCPARMDTFNEASTSRKGSLHLDYNNDDCLSGKSPVKHMQNSCHKSNYEDKESFLGSLSGKSPEPVKHSQNSRRKSDDEDEESFLRSLHFPASSNPTLSKVDKHPITIESDASNDGNSESYFLSMVSGLKSTHKSEPRKRVLKTINIDSSDEENGETLSSKSPLKLVSNSRDFSEKSFHSTIASDSPDEGTSKTTSPGNSSIRKSISRKRLRKVVSSDEENNETLKNQTASPDAHFTNNKASKKRSRKVFSSDEETDKISNSQTSLPSISLSSDTSSMKHSRKVLSSDEEDSKNESSKFTTRMDSDSNASIINKHSEEINSSDEETCVTPNSKISLHLNSDSNDTPNSKASHLLNSASKNTPNSKTLLYSNSASDTPDIKISRNLNSDSNDTPNAKISLHLDSDSNDTPNSKASLLLNSASKNTPSSKTLLYSNSASDTPDIKISRHLNSDSNDTPNAKISLHLDSDSNDSPFKLNSSSFNTVTKTRKLRIDSDSD